MADLLSPLSTAKLECPSSALNHAAETHVRHGLDFWSGAIAGMQHPKSYGHESVGRFPRFKASSQ